MGNHHSDITKSSAGNQQMSSSTKSTNGGFLHTFKNLLRRFYTFFFSAKQRKLDPILPVKNPVVSSTNDHASSSSSSSADYVGQKEVKIHVPSFETSLEHRNESDDAVDEDVSIQNGDESVINTSGEKVEKEKEIITCVVDKGKWIKHYHSSHKILLVGEGDFSFSASLAMVFGTASNLIATSLDSRNFLKKNYANAVLNIRNLRNMGCRVMHEIDATQIAYDNLLGEMEFDRIVFNFPFAGFFKGLPRDKVLKKHRRLVSLFLKNAKELIDRNGEIHISHKTNNFHSEWKLESIASSHGLRLIEAAEFNQQSQYYHMGYSLFYFSSLLVISFNQQSQYYRANTLHKLF